MKLLKTFKGGVYPSSFKDTTKNIPIEIAPLPDRVIIPFIQCSKKICEPFTFLIKEGDKVKTGQIIAQSQKNLSPPIHASISGIVSEIKEYPHPELGRAKAALIESDGIDEKDYLSQKRDYRTLSKDDILEIIKAAGIVGLGGASFPTHIKLTIPEGEKVDSFIVNLCECEPYLTVDFRLVLEKADEFIEGIKIILRVLGIEFAYIGIENDKREVIKILNEKVKYHKEIRVVSLKSKYPQGEEKQLIKAVLNRIVPENKLPLEVNVVVHNSQTILAVYEAVCFNKPLYEKVITVAGEVIREPKNIKVRIGTLLDDIVNLCGGLNREEFVVIFGGPMMGISQVDVDLKIPIIRGTSGVLFLPKEKLDLTEESQCIRCGRCFEVCPVRLFPVEINKLVKNKRWDELQKLYIFQCMECGCCEYVCPSKIPLLKRIKLGKKAATALEKSKS